VLRTHADWSVRAPSLVLLLECCADTLVGIAGPPAKEGVDHKFCVGTESLGKLSFFFVLRTHADRRVRAQSPIRCGTNHLRG
jgi:hypothetical protein